MKRAIVILLIAIAGTRQAGAQGDKEKSSSFQPILDFFGDHKIAVRQGAVDKNAIEKPATFQYINSRTPGTKDSYAIDIGVSGNAFPNTSVAASHIFLGPSVEYHKQTLIKKEQETFQSGLTYFQVFGDITEKPLVSVLQGSIKYKHDAQTTGKGMLAKAEYLPVIKSWAVGEAQGPDWLQFLWQPLAGLQLETGDNIAKSKRGGNDERLKLSIQAGLYPLGKRLQKRLELTSDYTYWRSFAESGAFNLVANDRHLFRADLNYYLNNDQNFAIGVEYLNGEDPENGLPKQEIITAAFKVKF